MVVGALNLTIRNMAVHLSVAQVTPGCAVSGCAEHYGGNLLQHTTNAVCHVWGERDWLIEAAWFIGGHVLITSVLYPPRTQHPFA